ncbi:MAG: DUF1015 family protein [Verrucomicrobiota bacterium]|nr:DUF1015 family protein [Verrucomicrobiota bacterium]
MATVLPFPALRPKPELASQICELPYDVMSSDEAREMAQGNPLSFLHVSKPEIDLDPSVDIYDPKVYAKGAENFAKLITNGSLVQDPQPYFYLYRQIMGEHTQLGLVAAVSCEEYRLNVIRKHEFTRPDKEDDRVRHIEGLNSQTGPVFLTYKSQSDLKSIFTSISAQEPDIDFTAKDGIQHTSWAVKDAEVIRKITAAFASIKNLYIADGHHRSAAASRVDQTRRSAGHSSQFLAVIFPHDEMQILPYNRVVKDLAGLSALEVLKRIGDVAQVKPNLTAKPSKKHNVSMFLDGKWHTLEWWPQVLQKEDKIGQLDVSLLQNFVLSPILGIDDPRRDKRINFVGGIRGTAELEKLVKSGTYAIAFSMFPTSIVDLMEIADEGGIMPPKSTWFEPKLRDAMFCHTI